MDTDTLKPLPKQRETDRFTPLMIFASDHDFPAFAKEHGINYKPVMGLYQGLIEESFVVSEHDAGIVQGADLLRGQEGVILLMPQEAIYNGNRDTFFASIDIEGYVDPDKREYIGKWHKVTVTEALHSDTWTCYPEDNAWYVAKMPDTPTCDTLSQ